MDDGGEAFEYRFLHIDPSRPPTSNPIHAAPHEPEMVAAEYEQKLAGTARRRDRQRRLAAYASMRATVFASFDEFLNIVGSERGIGSSIRAARRSLEQVGAKVAR